VTFAAPLKLNTDFTTRPQWQANLSVSPNTPCYKMYSRKSNDNGFSWLADDTLSDVPARSLPSLTLTSNRRMRATMTMALRLRPNI